MERDFKLICISKYYDNQLNKQIKVNETITLKDIQRVDHLIKNKVCSLIAIQK